METIVESNNNSEQNEATDTEQEQKDSNLNSDQNNVMLQKSLRRFNKNESAWSILKPECNTIRNESSKAVTIREMKFNNHSSGNNGSSGGRKSFTSTLRSSASKNRLSLTKKDAKRSLDKVSSSDQKHTPVRNKLANFIDFMKDEYRRLTKPENYDPYVKVSLKPATIEKSFKTNVIYGGGSNVSWDLFADENKFTFLLRNEMHALKSKYLKIEVFDYESGSADQCLGAAYIATKGLRVDEQRFAVLDLYENNFETGYAWAGTVEISATFKKLALFEVEEITAKMNDDIENEINKKNNVNTRTNAMKKMKKMRSRGMTDQLILGRVGSRGMTLEDPFMKSKRDLTKQLLVEDEKKHDEEREKINSIRGRVTLLVLFTSLILSGMLFFGAMNLYEVELQQIFYEVNYATTFSMLDSLHWGFVTASTIGYGDLYPQTTGGKIFGFFFIVFGVSLLGRLLNFVLTYENDKFEADRKRRATFRKSMTWGQMIEWDVDGDEKISKYEFLRGMLIRRQDTTEQFINEIMKIFETYDADKSGEIEIDELKEIMRKKAEDMQEKIKKQTMEKDEQNYWDLGCFKIKRNKTIHKNKQAEKQLQEKKEEKEEETETGAVILTEKNNHENIQETQQKKDNFNIYGNDKEKIKNTHSIYEFADDEPFEYGLQVIIYGCDNLKEEHADFEDSLKTFVKSILGFMIHLIIAAIIFSFVENANFGDMLWFCVVTACTVGYGDQHPQSSFGRILNAFFIAISVVLFVSFFGSAFDFLYKRQELLMNQKQKAKNDMNEMIENFHFKTLQNVLKTREENEKNKNKGKSQQVKKKKSRLQVILDDVDDKEEESECSHQTLWDALNSPTPPKENKRSEVDWDKLDTMKSSKNLNLLLSEEEEDSDHSEYMKRALSHVHSSKSPMGSVSVYTPKRNKMDTTKSLSSDLLSVNDNEKDGNNNNNNNNNDEKIGLLGKTVENVMYKNEKKTVKGYTAVETNDNNNEYID